MVTQLRIQNMSYNNGMHLDEAIEQYLEYLTIEKNRSKRTVANYSHYLTRLQRLRWRYYCRPNNPRTYTKMALVAT